ncbi:hypothetical protein DAPPUDRAFT_115799 [Daphnia pulex]|uniref:Transposase domain-containing protein n=1 Tax=Daphnia pulex TaxID=6669 RepID=E9HMK4_DAPPU|nr:hypothetical protein DAPPUDRAFT_115799 [Daphnia pulex]|eukprot:EFX67037.1 hypothetical protein DAPPUDRAFT_115799 [Daphnia pulex]
MHRAFGYVGASTLRRRAAKLFGASDSTIEEDELPTQQHEDHYRNNQESSSNSSNISSSDQSTFSDDSCSVSIQSDICTTEPIDGMTESVEDRFGAIVTKHRLTRSAIKDFANFLVSLGHNIHTDARTIFKTPRTKINSDSFQHFGLIKELLLKLKSGIIDGRNGIKLQFNIDGSNLYKSGTKAFWPILCRVSNANDSRPFPVSIFCGDGEKPPDLNLYLEPFLNELKPLEENGMDVNDRHLVVKSIAFICDAPARSFVKGIIGHTGKYACERCTVIGETVNNHMTFTAMSSRPRTNDSFRSGRDRRHHNEPTPLLRLRMDIVKCFPIDYMHLTCLGLIILKEVLPEDEYNNFLYFLVAMRLLLSRSPNKRQIVFADQCLRKYVYDFGVIYGAQHLVYNFHNIIHLANDCSFYKSSLNDISAFPFESYLGEMKKEIKGTIKPLAQYYRRYNERLHFDESNPHQPNKTSIFDSLREDSTADSFIMLSKTSIYKIATMKKGCQVIVAQELYITEDEDGSKFNFFTFPMPATNLGIYVCDRLSRRKTTLPITVVETARKCVVLPFQDSENEDKWLVVPLLHTM